MKFLSYSFIFLTIFLSGCRTTKTTTSQMGGKLLLSEKDILKAHTEAFPSFETLVGTLNVSYDNGKKQQSLPLSFRMKKDEALWLSAPLGIAKALITKDKVQFYNKLDNTYFEGDYSISSQYLGIPLSFEMLQNLLLGQILLQKEIIDVQPFNDGYRGNVSSENLDIAFVLTQQCKVDNTQIRQKGKERSLQASYSYQQVDHILFPWDLHLLVEAEEFIQIKLKFSNLQRNVAVKFPYSVPSGYQPLTLEP
nr:DUF4292 domain-containing protein [uncultured Capnocytophaga sp.]